MEVASFIREYLYKQDYLDVPGLGTFFLSKDPFSVDNPQNKIKPSVKTLIFRENTRVTGDSLVHFMARRKQISLEEARTSINQFNNEIRALIKRKGTAEILGFGKFMSDNGINLDFKAHPNNYSAISFGLGELNLPPLERPQDKKFLPEQNTLKWSDTQSLEFPILPPSENSPRDLSIDSNKESLPQADSPLSSLANSPEPEANVYYEDHLDGESTRPLPSKSPEKEGDLLHPTDTPHVSPHHLPTAEELYKTYHFERENPEFTGFHPPEHSPTAESHESEVVSHSPTFGSHALPLDTYSVASETENQTPISNSSKEEIPAPVTKIENPRIENPLSFTFPGPITNTSVEVEPMSEASFHDTPVSNSGSLTYPGVKSNTASGFGTLPGNELQHPPQFEPYRSENGEGESHPGTGRNFVWVWILSTLFLVATLLGLAYVEKTRVAKKLHEFFPGVKSFGILEPVQKMVKKDSVPTEMNTSPNGKAKDTTLGSTKAIQANPSKSQDSIHFPSKVDSLKITSPGSIIDENNIIIKPIKEAEQFLVIGADYYRVENAKKYGLENFKKKGIYYFIVDASKEHIYIKDNKPVKYFVCLGEYREKATANQKIQELPKEPLFSGNGKPYVFHNTYTSNP